MRGHPISEETKKKISIANKGRKPSALAILRSTQALKGKVGHMKGFKHTLETKTRMSQAFKGRIPWNKGKTKETDSRVAQYSIKLIQSGIKPSFKGYRHSEITRRKISCLQQGISLEAWKAFSRPENAHIRSSNEYRLWREAVFTRDNYTCVWCRKKSSKDVKAILQADHIKPFAYFPELRFAIDNGRTLCVECHRTTDTYGKRWYKLYKK